MRTKSWTRKSFDRSATLPIRKSRHRARLALEALEDRTIPSRIAGLLSGLGIPSQAETASLALPTGVFPSSAHIFLAPHSTQAPLEQDGGGGGSASDSIPYNGGTLLTHVQVQGVYYNDPTTLGFQSQMDGFFSDIVQSPWVTQMLANFSVGSQTIGAGSFLGDDNTGLTFQNAGMIPSQLLNELADGRLAAPNGNTLYAVFVPPGSLGGFALGYHGAFIEPSSGKVIYYMVIDSLQDPKFTEFQGRTSVASHELSEAITDPGVGIATTAHPGGDLGWSTQFAEIGDVSEGSDLVTYHGYVTQEEWGRGPTDPPNLALGPIVAPADTDFVVTHVKSDPTEGINNGVIANFTDKDGAPESPSQFTVIVDWGDARSSRSDDGSGNVTVTSNGDGTFNVIGRHTYSGEAGTTYGGHFPDLGVGITGASVFVSSGDEVALTTTTITLQEAGPLTNVSAHNFRFVPGQTLTDQMVATFIDPGGTAGADPDIGEYQATVNWGDGTANDSNVTIVANGNGHYSVVGNSHTYSSAGGSPHQVTVTVTYDGTTNAVVGQATEAVPTTFMVTSLLDDGSLGTLRWAVGQANAAAGLPTITFAPSLFNTPQTILLTGGPLELSNTSATETLMGPAVGVTLNGGGLSRVFQVDAAVSASFSGLTITGGKTAGSGGGLDNEGGIAALTDCVVSGNNADNNGGAIYSLGLATFNNCTVSGNSATRYGGGIYNNGTVRLTGCTLSGNSAYSAGGMYNNGPATLTNCTVSGNSAGLFGGGLLDFATMRLTGCTISGNSAGVESGGLDIGSFKSITGYSKTGSAELTHCAVSGNSARYAGGLFNGGTVTLTDCTVSGNSATGFGGGLVNYRTAVLADCTISGNSARSGGGLYNLFGSVTLTDCTVSSNSATGNGGGLFLRSTATLTDCTLSGNAAGVEGGGLFNTYSTATLANCTVSSNSARFGGGVETFGGNTTLTDCSVKGNSAGSNGGGVDNFGSGTTTLTGCTVSANVARNGGGVSNFSHHTLTLTNCSITGNSTTSVSGGLFNSGTMALTDCTIGGNSARFSGGGLMNLGTAALTGCTVSGNSANYGGGLYNAYGTAGLTNCTVSGNSARYGGGVLNYDGDATLSNCTVSGDSARFGGGLYNYPGGGTLNVCNTIAAGNTETIGGPDAVGLVISEGHNLVGATDGSAGWVSSDLTGTAAAPLNPLLAPLGNYGGPTQTMPLLPGSPAIDAGTSTGAPALDQRGQARVGAVDIGAFESQGFTIAVTSGSSQSTDISTAFAAPLVVTVIPNSPSEPVAGGRVTFKPPTSGASATLGSSPATISAAGTASVTATANGFAGSYTVSASATGITTPATFSLANRPAITVPGAQTAYQNVDQTIKGISIGDDPSASLTVTLNVSHGTLTLQSTTGLTTATGNDTGSVILIGTTANLNAALATLLYRGLHNYSGGDTLTLAATDSGVSATPASVAITVDSIAQETANLQNLVSALQTAGVLNQGQANSLIVTLNLQGNNGDVGKVQAFLNQVTADLAAGLLTPAQADALLGPGRILLLSVTRR